MFPNSKKRVINMADKVDGTKRIEVIEKILQMPNERQKATQDFTDKRNAKLLYREVLSCLSGQDPVLSMVTLMVIIADIDGYAMETQNKKRDQKHKDWVIEMFRKEYEQAAGERDFVIWEKGGFETKDGERY